MPLASVTLILPASATRPEAGTIGLVTWPLLMPIATVWPLPHSELEAAMWTLHSPSKGVEAAAGVASGEARAKAMLVAIKALLKYPMTGPCVFDAGIIAGRGFQGCDGCHIVGRTLFRAQKERPRASQ